jgi:hypothetical protein
MEALLKGWSNCSKTMELDLQDAGRLAQPQTCDSLDCPSLQPGADNAGRVMDQIKILYILCLYALMVRIIE